MGFQDLLDDLACWNVCQTEVTPAGYEVKDSPALAVARRVAALYGEHLPCHGEGCGPCGFSGVQPAKPEARDAEAVARHLFEEE